MPLIPALVFTATAYCQGSITASGTRVSQVTIAVDRRVVRAGTKVRVLVTKCIYRQWYGGIKYAYDTGSAIRGRRVDIYMADCRSAKDFGHRRVRLQIIE